MTDFNLIQGDCIEEMQKLIDDDVKVDLILTDPPYGTTACKWDSVIPFKDMWECINSLSYDTTPILLFGSEPFSSNLRMSNIKNYRYDWIWYKNTCTGFPFAKKQPMRNHEIISVFYNKQCKYYPIKEDRDATTDSLKRMKYSFQGNHDCDIYNLKNKDHDLEDKCYPKTIKRFKTVPNSKGRLHPSQKPVELLEYLIKTYTKENDTVLDFTMGSGSTGVACKNTNRNFIGIELEEDYYNIACERINDNQSKLI